MGKVESKKENKEPEKKFRSGRITATIWKNEVEVNGEAVEIPHIVIERNYKDKDDNWAKTSSFGLNELPDVNLVSRKAYEYLKLKE